MKQQLRLYFDYAAATPLAPEVVAAMQPYFQEHFGNPSSLHAFGQVAAQDLERFRAQIAQGVGAHANEIFFTGSGTESCNLAILGAALANQGRGRHLITTAAEHEAVLAPFAKLAKLGFEITYVPVDEFGLVRERELRAAIRPDTILVSLMYANNEVGSIHDLPFLSKLIKKANPQTLFHADACQAAALLTMDVGELGIDLLSWSAAKIYGPKGIAALYKKRGVHLEPQLLGGGQEFGLRSGTQSVALIAGFAKAMDLAKQARVAEERRLCALRDQLWEGLCRAWPGLQLNGHERRRLANMLNISVEGIDAEALVFFLDQEGLAVSTGAACSTSKSEPSHVLLAMGADLGRAKGSLRFSLGKGTTEQQIARVVEIFPQALQRLTGLKGQRQAPAKPVYA
jgi:cysteine desulfurase